LIASPFLRSVVAFDAFTCAAAGALMTLAAAPLADWTGLPAPLLRTAGALLLPYAAVLGGSPPAPPYPAPR
jgi:hypothetical protein